jgi:hypothetical protein
MRVRWFDRRALALHATVLVVVPAFLALCFWQVERATSGNGLSWAYVFEWPFFAGYAVYMWWRLLHEEPRTSRAEHAGSPAEAERTLPQAPAGTPAAAGWGAAPQAADIEGHEPTSEELELAAYNRYLAELEASGRRKRW